MRIISGKYRGRCIKMPYAGIRPTQNKVRKALFDTLGSVEGLSFLDLFAGSGAVGLEALSYGAKGVVFVENDPVCVKALEANIAHLVPFPGDTASICPGRYQRTGPISDNIYILPLDVFRGINKLWQKGSRFNIIFLDPPYGGGSAKKTLQTLEAYDILSPAAFVIVQHFKKDCLPDKPGAVELYKKTRYGDTVLSFYSKKKKAEVKVK